MVAFAVLLAVAVAAPTPTPPPTIVTIKTSALCNALRTDISQSVMRLIVQEFQIAQGRTILHDMAKMEVEKADLWIEMDNTRLLNVVDSLASNDTKLEQLLD